MALAGRALAVWVIVIAAETIHGIVRTLLLAPRVGDFRARQIAVFTGAAIIIGITMASIRWMRPPHVRAALGIGGLWLVLTLVFEVTLGRATGASWARILEDYDLRQGGLLALGMAVLAMAPLIAAYFRGVLPYNPRRG
jgi:hypothetical protein